MLEIVATCIVLTAMLAYLNYRLVGLPTPIGVMAAAMLASLALIALDSLGIAHGVRVYAERLLRSIDFSHVLMQGMLSLLLFAGALHVDLSELRTYRWQVGVLAVVATVLSTVLVGVGSWFVLSWVGVDVSLSYCLLFGALISPTDPIAVMGILKSAGAPRNLELVIAGESLFNDGVGVVIFSLLLELVSGSYAPTWTQGLHLLAQEAGGGLLFGFVLGYVTFRLLKSVDSYQVEVLLTLATVMGGYALADRLHVSGPLAMVVVGLIIGNGGRVLAMSDTTRRYMDMFWELIDEILNAVLFVLIGLEVLLVPFSPHTLLAAALALGVTLWARAVTVGLPVALLPRAFRLPKGSGWVLWWGGLRGGISVALALSLPAGPQRDLILALTYCIVAFSILGQGLTIGRIVRWSLGRTWQTAPPATSRSHGG
jgi:CPA1 family monovalent cation:H+ antiporter